MAESGQKLPQREAGVFKKIVVSLSLVALHNLASRANCDESYWCAPNGIAEVLFYCGVFCSGVMNASSTRMASSSVARSSQTLNSVNTEVSSHTYQYYLQCDLISTCT